MKVSGALPLADLTSISSRLPACETSRSPDDVSSSSSSTFTTLKPAAETRQRQLPRVRPLFRTAGRCGPIPLAPGRAPAGPRGSRRRSAWRISSFFERPQGGHLRRGLQRRVKYERRARATQTPGTCCANAARISQSRMLCQSQTSGTMYQRWPPSAGMYAATTGRPSPIHEDRVRALLSPRNASAARPRPTTPPTPSTQDSTMAHLDRAHSQTQPEIPIGAVNTLRE